jgi:hypothetical protein
MRTWVIIRQGKRGIHSFIHSLHTAWPDWGAACAATSRTRPRRPRRPRRASSLLHPSAPIILSTRLVAITGEVGHDRLRMHPARQSSEEFDPQTAHCSVSVPLESHLDGGQGSMLPLPSNLRPCLQYEVLASARTEQDESPRATSRVGHALAEAASELRRSRRGCREV